MHRSSMEVFLQFPKSRLLEYVIMFLNKSETYFYENSMSILTLNLSSNPELNVLSHEDVSYSMRKLNVGLTGGISVF